MVKAILTLAVGIVIGFAVVQAFGRSREVQEGQTVVYVTRLSAARHSNGKPQTVPGDPFAFSCATSGVGDIRGAACYVLSKGEISH